MRKHDEVGVGDLKGGVDEQAVAMSGGGVASKTARGIEDETPRRRWRIGGRWSKVRSCSASGRERR